MSQKLRDIETLSIVYKKNLGHTLKMA